MLLTAIQFAEEFPGEPKPQADAVGPHEREEKLVNFADFPELAFHLHVGSQQPLSYISASTTDFMFSFVRCIFSTNSFWYSRVSSFSRKEKVLSLSETSPYKAYAKHSNRLSCVSLEDGRTQQGNQTRVGVFQEFSYTTLCRINLLSLQLKA